MAKQAGGGSNQGRALTVGGLIVEARQALGLNQGQLAQRLEVTQRTLSRWEHDVAPPSHRSRVAIVAAVASAPEPMLTALAAALGVTAPPSSRVTVAAVLTPDPAARRAALDDALYANADELDVSPRRLRAALADLLREAEVLGLTLAEARAALRSKERGGPRAKR